MVGSRNSRGYVLFNLKSSYSYNCDEQEGKSVKVVF